MWPAYRFATLIGWGIAGLYWFPAFLLGGGPRDSSIALLIIYVASLPALYMLVRWGVWNASARCNRSYAMPFDSSLERIDALLRDGVESYTKNPVDERWFNGREERAGVPREVLEWKEGRPMVVFELTGDRFVKVAEHLWKGGELTGVEVWPVKGEAAAPLEALMSRIDQVLDPSTL